jgi:hypothetical protein
MNFQLNKTLGISKPDEALSAYKEEFCSKELVYKWPVHLTTV